MTHRFNSCIRSTAAMCLLIVILFAVTVAAAKEPNSFEKIDAAYRAGDLDRRDMLVAQATAFFAPQDLSAEFKSVSPGFIKSGTGLVMQIRDEWDLFTPDQQELLTSYLNRPSKPYSFISASGYFKIHYDTSGGEPVPPADTNGNMIPDYVERLGEYLDSARTAYLYHMGYLQPPIDTAGGDSKYDVYLLSILGYGYTAPDYPGDSAWNDYASYIAIHCRMDFGIFPNDDPEGDVIGALKVTAAHEFFHAVQLAYKYDLQDFLWLMEATSTWMEEVVYPVVNDNINYLPGFFSYPHVSLLSTQDNHEYGDFIWPAFLHQRFDAPIIRLIWEAARYNQSLPAHDSALAEYGVTLRQAFAEFTVWNYFTGSRAAAGKYYEEAAIYPEIFVEQSYPTLVHDSVTPVTAPDGLACNYMEFVVDPSAFGMLEMKLDGSETVRWALSGVVSGSDFDTSYTEISIVNEDLYVRHPFIDDYIRVVAIPANIIRSQTTGTYFLDSGVLPYGDASYDTSVSIADAIYLIDYIFRAGPAPMPFIESGDADCSGLINIADAVLIINYVFKGGDAPCADR